jgi:hypothetical protein
METEIKVNIKMKDKEVELTEKEARDLYESLGRIFEKSTVFIPSLPFDSWQSVQPRNPLYPTWYTTSGDSPPNYIISIS